MGRGGGSTCSFWHVNGRGVTTDNSFAISIEVSGSKGIEEASHSHLRGGPKRRRGGQSRHFGRARINGCGWTRGWACVKLVCACSPVESRPEAVRVQGVG